MREDWVKKQLGEIASVTYGFTGKSFTEGAFRYVRITDIDNNGELTLEEKKYLEYSEELEKFTLENNDLLMARTGATFAKVLLYEDFEPSVFASYLIKIEFKEKTINKLYWYFSKSESYWEQANSLSSGSAQPHFNGAALKKVVFTFPKSLSEQKQIVEILDEAFTAIDQAKANIEQNIANATALFQSKLNAIFSQKGDGWEEKKLNEICEVKDGTHNSPKYVGEEFGIPFVTQKNILNSGISFKNTKFISEEDHNDFYRRSNVANNDILVSMIGANRGMSCIVDDKRVFSIKNVGLIKSNENYRAKFILYFLKSPIAKKYVAENSSGSAQGFIGLTKLRAFPIPFTNIENQKKIELLIESLNDSINTTVFNYTLKLNSLEELKKSILQKAFSGELTQKEAVV